MWLKQSVIAGSLALLFTSAPALAQETAKTTFQAEVHPQQLRRHERQYSSFIMAD